MKKSLIIITFLSQICLCQNNFWEQTNGIRYGEVKFTFSNGDNVLLVGGIGSIYRSKNDGNDWMKYKNGLPNTLIGPFIGSKNQNIFAASDSGLYKSVNMGESWDLILTDKILSLTTNDSGLIFAGGTYRLYISTDEGGEWLIKNAPTSPIGIATDSNGYIFIGSERASGIWGSYGGIYRSSNLGSNWEKINNGLPGNFIVSTINCNKDGVVYFGGDYSFYYSTNQGDIWIEINLPGAVILSSLVFNSLNHLFIGDRNVNIGRGGLYKSTNNGLTWIRYYQEIDNNIVKGLFIDVNDRILAGTSGGVYRLSNESWHWIFPGFSYITVSGLGIDNEGNVFASTKKGFYLSSDWGDNYTQIQKSSFGVFDRPIVNGKNWIYLYNAEGILRSSDKGNSWVQINNGIVDTRISQLVLLQNDFLLAKNYSKKIFFSIDDGNTWISKPHPEIGVLGSDLINKIFLTGIDSCIYFSTNFGDSWVEIDFGYNPIGLFCSNKTENIYFFSRETGIFRSNNGGIQWELMNSSFQTILVKCAIIDSKDNIYIGLWNSMGVYKSSDYGTSWNEVNDGLGNRTILDLIINKNDFLFAATYNNGVYRSQSSLTSIEPINENSLLKYKLYQNYPNPFNPSTKINYSIPQAGLVVLIVYDVLGNEITTLVNEEKPVGNYELNFDAKNLSSGVYFYRIQVGNFSETKKFILLK